MDLYVIPHGDGIVDIFKNSRVLSKYSVGILLKRLFGMQERDLAIWVADKSGIYANPAQGTESTEPEHRVWHIIHRDFQAHFSGRALNDMATKFAEFLAQGVAEMPEIDNVKWTTMPDLDEFLRRITLRAAVQALCGPGLLEVCPSFAEDFWAYDVAFPTIFRRIPRVLAPKAYEARRKLQENMRRWHVWAMANFDWENQAAIEESWEPVYGSRLMRARVVMLRDSGMSLDGWAALDSGFIWTANANSIPAGIWAVLDILRTRGLRERIMAEIDPCFCPNSLTLDIPKLCSKPLLNSVYMEGLRLRAAATVTRQVTSDNFHIGSWKIPKGGNMALFPWFAGRDEYFWNEGRDDDTHPVSRFWAERFLSYPDDPASGPIRKHDDPAIYQSKMTGKESRSRNAEDDARATLITTGIQGHFYPFGGGIKICPGRYLAKQEVMIMVAILLRAYEVEFVDPIAAEGATEDLTRFPLGILPPKGEFPFRIRRRNI